MLKTTAVVITVPGQETVRIGPFIAPTNAARYASKLRTIAAARRLPATITTETTQPGPEHLDARLPTDAWSLAQLLTTEEDHYGDDVPFPDIYTRLIVQVGEEQADKTRDRATGWSGSGDDQTRRIELIEAAEEWREQRAQASAALQSIAVELWRADLRNINQIHGITGLSRATIYAALREHGIEPKDRT